MIDIPGIFSKEYLASFLTINDDEENSCNTYEIVFEGCSNSEDDPRCFVQADMNKVEYARTVINTENGEGREVAREIRLNRFFSFNLVVNDYWLDWLQRRVAESEMAVMTTMDQNALPTDIVEMEIIELQPSDLEETHFIKLRFRLGADAAIGKDACCTAQPEGEPIEDDCGPDGGNEEDPPEEGLCDDFAVSVSRSGNTITANVQGAPGSYSISWRYRPNENGQWIILGSGSSVSLGAYGQYQAVVVALGCGSLSDTYIYLDPCTGQSITLRSEGNTLIVDSEINVPGASYIWELYDDITSDWVTLGTTNDPVFVLSPANDGTYRVNMQYGDCSFFDVLEFDSESCPTGAVSILEANGLLLASLDADIGNDEPEWAWYKDDGQGGGKQLYDQATDLVPVNGNGIYFAEATWNGCKWEAYVLIINQVECEPCQLEANITVVENIATIDVQNCNGEAIILWFRYVDKQWIQVGAGESIEVSGNNLYRANVICGECKVEIFHANVDCDACEDFSVEITQDGNQFTANVDCEDAEFRWIRRDETGDVELNVNGPTITPTVEGLYEVYVTCGDCTATARFIAYECEGCLYIFQAGNPNPIIVCN